MKKTFINFIVSITLVCTVGMQAAQAQILAYQGGTQETAVRCGHSALVVEEVNAVSGSPVRVRLGEFEGQRSENTIIVKHNGVELLSYVVTEATKESMDLPAVTESLKILTDLCTMNPRELKVFDELVELTILPRLRELGILENIELSEQGNVDTGYGGSFWLIVVLFILLVIVGAGFGEET